MSDAPGDPPSTGSPEVDEALADVRQLEELPAADHHEVLASAHELLQRRLDPDQDQPSSS